MIRAGVAVVDVTPPVGTAMDGYAARTAAADGVHDRITVRAVCVEDTAVVTVDVCGLHEDLCAAVAERCVLPVDGVRVHATHTHGGPACMPGRFGGGADPGWLGRLEDACVGAIDTAARRRVPARLLAGYGAQVDVARNRRRPDGPVDRAVPVVRIVAEDNSTTIAVLTSYACHPVALGADNTLFTGDYPAVVRRVIEERCAGAVALFLTGCAGDANTGHTVSLQASVPRTFAAAERAGTTIAKAVLDARLAPYDGPVTAARGTADLEIADDPGVDRAGWQERAAGPDPDTAVLMRHWLDWADRISGTGGGVWTAPVGVLDWGGVRIVTLPGEPFAQTGLDVRAALDADGNGVTMVAGYTDGCPGYLPTAGEYALGGYEVAEAHRYYGMPGPFARGSAERLVETARQVYRAVVAAAELKVGRTYRRHCPGVASGDS